MITQLDPGFTAEGFWVNALLQFLGTLGALAVAFAVYLRSSKEERARFEEELRHNRELLQASFEHDLSIRRQEDMGRKEERDKEAHAEQGRLLVALLSEFDGNVQAIDFMQTNPPDRIPLRRSILDANLGSIGSLPTPVGCAIQLASLHIDQANAVPNGSQKFDASLIIARNMISAALHLLANHIGGSLTVEVDLERYSRSDEAMDDHI